MTDLRDKILEAMSISDYKAYFDEELGEGTKMNTSGWVEYLCPWHDDTNPSLNVNFFKEGAYRCQACGETGDIFTFYQRKHSTDFKGALKYFAERFGVSDDDGSTSRKPKKKVLKLAPPPDGPPTPLAKSKKKQRLGPIDEIYQYKDLNGNVVYEVCRYSIPRKTFRQRRPFKDGYIWNLNGVEIIPYNLKSVTESDTVFIVEGEKDANNLTSIGLVATCNPMGAGKWPNTLTPYFKGKTVYILPDNDDEGRNHAKLVADKLYNVADSIIIVSLAGLPPKGDVSDWLAMGHTAEELLELCKDFKPYEDHIEWMNKRHAAIMVSGKFKILNEEIDPVTKRPIISYSNVGDLYHRYASRKILNPNYKGDKRQKKYISIVSDWLQSDRRREYDGIIFSPARDVPGYYNLWRGFPIKPQQGDWSLMQEHILENICNGNKFYADWLITWMAHIVQRAGRRRPGTCVVLRGEQGCGKGILMSSFGSLLWPHYLQITNPSQLVGRFNSHLEGLLFLFVDEGFWAGDKASEGILKGIITEEMLAIERKGQDVYPIKNHVSVAIASNNDWVVPAGRSERRYFVLDVSSKHKQDLQYFTAIRLQMENGGYEAMLYDLMHKDLSKIDVRRIPKTKALMDQVAETMTCVEQFWFSRLMSGTLIYNNDNPNSDWYSDSEIYISTEVLYNQYIEFAKDLGIRYRKSPASFGKTISRMCPKRKRKYITKGSIEASTYGYERWVYIFPNLNLCRDSFEEYFSTKIAWEPFEEDLDDSEL